MALNPSPFLLPAIYIKRLAAWPAFPKYMFHFDVEGRVTIPMGAYFQQ